ncbi:MAG: histidine kinase [Dehalococcoidia bacterium]
MRHLSVLRYLLIWPIFRLVGDRARRQLAWRLSVSHLSTVLASLVALFLLIWMIAVVVTLIFDPAGAEPATDAKAVAQVLTGDMAVAPRGVATNQDALGPLLGALARRHLQIDREAGMASFDFDSNTRLEHVRSISVISSNGTVLVSSDPSLTGRTAASIAPAADRVVQHALAGSTDRRENSVIQQDGDSAAVGAYPLRAPDGERLAVLVDKASLTNPRGWEFLRESALMLLGAAGINLLLLIVPATAVAAAIGIPKARSIVRPVQELSDAALTLADGDLDRRVTVRGNDEVAALASSFNLMADHLQATISNEASERVRAEERTRELTALLEISRMITSTLELRPLVSLLLDQLRHVIDYSGATLMTLSNEVLTVLDARTFGSEETERGMRIPVDARTPIWQAITALQPVIIGDVRGDGPMARQFRRNVGARLDTTPFRSVRSWLAVPLVVKDRVTGMLSVSHHEPDVFTEQHARLVRAVADQAALAIENARLYQRASSLAALEERNRLARDLHDSVTQSIFSVAMMVRAAQIQYEQNAPALGETLDRIRLVAVDALAEMRSLIFELRPAPLDDDGLCGALNKLVESIQVRTDARVSFSAQVDALLAPDAEAAIFRIVQEALGNAVKHARAKSIAVRVVETGDLIQIRVSDDGTGFDPDAAIAAASSASSNGVGLRSMHERALAAGLVLRVESQPTAGTCVVIEAEPQDHGTPRAGGAAPAFVVPAPIGR